MLEDKTALEIAAQIWCQPQHSNKPLDEELAKSFAEIVEILLKENKELKVKVDSLKEDLEDEFNRCTYWKHKCISTSRGK